MDTQRSLLFGILAWQSNLIDLGQLAEACRVWGADPDRPLADVLAERGWIRPADRQRLDRQVDRQLREPEPGTPALRPTVAEGAHPEQRYQLSDALLSGQRYSRTSIHASGGVGRVWLARDRHLGRDVALKELRAEFAGKGMVQARFLREARITGQLEHPGVVPVYELGRSPETGQLFYAMRFVRGRTLTEAAEAFHENRRAGRDDPLELVGLLSAFVSVCHTVAYAHARGVMHRDLKG